MGLGGVSHTVVRKAFVSSLASLESARECLSHWNISRVVDLDVDAIRVLRHDSRDTSAPGLPACGDSGMNGVTRRARPSLNNIKIAVHSEMAMLCSS